MKPEERISLVKGLFGDQGQVSKYAHYISKDVVIHGPGSGQKTVGLEAAQKGDQIYQELYPEKSFEIKEIFSAEQKVFVQWVCRGKHKSTYKGQPIQKREFEIAGFSIYQIEEKKIIEIWQFWDRLGILEQIGEVSPKEPIEPGYYLELLKQLGMEDVIDRVALLSPREKDCLRDVLEGMTAKDTALKHNLSSRTVESYLDNIKAKLDCPFKRDLFQIAKILDKMDLI